MYFIVVCVLTPLGVIVDHFKVSSLCYWASEASPTLGCSIEISRDMCRSIGWYVVVSKNA